MKWAAIILLSCAVVFLFVRQEGMRSRLTKAEAQQEAIEHVSKGVDRIVEGMDVLKDLNKRVGKVESWVSGHPRKPVK